MNLKSTDAALFPVLAQLTHGDHLLAHLTIPGAPANKKNRPRPTWPWLYRQRLQHQGRKVTSLQDLFLAIDGHVASGDLWQARNLLQGAAQDLRPIIQPNSEFTRWARGVARVVKARPDLPRPLAPSGQLLKVEALFYLAPRQRPDLPGLLEAVCDSLEKCGLLESDYWVNDFGRSARVWPPKGGSKRAKAEREAWEPRTEVFVYDGGATR